MLVRYGNYTHDDNECTLANISRDFEYNELGGKAAMIERWKYTGWKQADTQAQLTAALILMEAQYAKDGQSLFFLTTGGAKTSHFIDATKAFYVHAKKPTYPVGHQAEYTTYRQFEIEIEAKFILNGGDGPGSVSDLMAYEESIEISGTGGPITELARVISGPWIPIMTADSSPMIIVQKGSAIGGTGTPKVSPPLYPDAILNPMADFKQSAGSPRILFPTARNYPVSWTYVMTFPQAIRAPLPTLPS
jgi:hypothetical protein